MNGPSDDHAIAAELEAIEGGRREVDTVDAARLIRHLSHPRKALRRLAAGALGAAIRRGGIPAEIGERLLASDDAHQRWGAAFALDRAGRRTSGSVEVALEVLGSGDGDLRWAAASIVIAAARDSAELRARLAALAGSGSATLRKMALLCLGDSGEKDESIYIAALDDPEALVRIAAMTAMSRARLVSPATLAAIGRSAEADVEPAVRRAAAAILRRLETSAPQE